MLKNGSHAVLRPAAPEDAARMLDYLRTCAAETDFLALLPEEWEIPVEKETALLREMAHNRDTMMLVCEADGIVAGTCQVMVMGRVKTETPCTVSIALRRAYWGLGITGPMFEEMEAFARSAGVIQLELAYAQGNERARRLLRPHGICRDGPGADAIRLKDGTLVDEIFMMKKL